MKKPSIYSGEPEERIVSAISNKIKRDNLLWHLEFRDMIEWLRPFIIRELLIARVDEVKKCRDDSQRLALESERDYWRQLVELEKVCMERQ